jgi:uncharacterized RDD family membrane protein YckC
MVPFIAILIVSGVAGLGAASGSDAGAGLGGLLAIGLFIGYVVWALVLFARGTTPGKNMLGMFVMKEDGRRAGFGTMLIREWIGKLISGFVWRSDSCGFFSIATTKVGTTSSSAPTS